MPGEGPSGSATEPLLRAEVDPDEPVYVPVVRAVAAVANEPATELPPLGEYVDPGALADLVAPGPFTGQVTFSYAGYVVRVRDDEAVAVYGEDPRSP